MVKQQKQEQHEAPAQGDSWLQQFKFALSILKNAALAGRDLSVDEVFQLETLCGWNSHESNKQLRKVRTRLQLQRVAGTDEDRQAAAKAVQDAQRIRATKGSEIQQQIEQLQRELSRLDSDVDRSQRRLQEMLDAKQQSLMALPTELQKYFAKQRGAIKNQLFPPVNEALTKLGHAKAMAAVDVSNSRALSTLGSRWVVTEPKAKRNVVKPEFLEYQQQCRSEIECLEAELAAAQSVLDDALAAFDEKLANFEL